jgi:CarD family transcriptional regulator
MSQDEKDGNIQFTVGTQVVYPSHGVGEIIALDAQKIGESTIHVYVISFVRDKMTLKVPVSRASAAGLRPVASRVDASKVYSTLQSKPKPGNRMWSRRAKDYETKINTGNLTAIAEVVRDLHKNADGDRSYSERTIYEAALNRLAGELAILENIRADEAVDKLTDILKQKSMVAA